MHKLWIPNSLTKELYSWVFYLMLPKEETSELVWPGSAKHFYETFSSQQGRGSCPFLCFLSQTRSPAAESCHDSGSRQDYDVP